MGGKRYGLGEFEKTGAGSSWEAKERGKRRKREGKETYWNETKAVGRRKDGSFVLRKAMGDRRGGGRWRASLSNFLSQDSIALSSTESSFFN